MKLFSLWSKSLWPWDTKVINVHWKMCTYSNLLQLLLYLGNANLYTMIVQIQIWKINLAFCFYIYGSLQVLSCGPWHSFDLVEIRKAQIKKIVYPLSHHHTLVLDRLGRLIILGSAFLPLINQKNMWVKIQHQMKVLNPIYMAPNMTVYTNDNFEYLFCII